jgi:DNA adenine methylase
LINKIKPTQPPLKWAGGKRKMSSIITAAADSIESPFMYYEPFFGGGAIFFSLFDKGLIRKAYLNDIVPQIVNFYLTISKESSLEELIKESKAIEEKFNNLIDNVEKRKKSYQELKEDFNAEWLRNSSKILTNKNLTKNNINLASKFLALNKLGFNGMFRLNSRGEFNIPMGSTGTKSLLDVENMHKVAKALEKATFTCDDYVNVKPFKGPIAGKNLIFLDPPYIPNSKTSNFTDYSAEGFNKEAHKNLSEKFSKLINKNNTNVILTNNYNQKSLELFVEKNKENNRIKAYKVKVMKSISANATSRGKTEELLVSTFPINHEDLEEL